MGYLGKMKVGSNELLVGSTLYGVCNTARDTAAKVVTLSLFDTILTGVTVIVKFTNGNSVANPTININNTGAKNLYGILTIGVGSFIPITYDGTNWYANGNMHAATAGADLLMYLNINGDFAAGTTLATLATANTGVKRTADGSINAANGTFTGTVTAKTYSGLPTASSSTAGIVKLNTTGWSSSETGIAASSAALSSAYLSITANYATNTKLTDGSVTKLGTSTVGSTSKPIYLNAGTPTAITGTVGSATQPVYLNAGTVTACTALKSMAYVDQTAHTVESMRRMHTLIRLHSETKHASTGVVLTLTTNTTSLISLTSTIGNLVAGNMTVRLPLSPSNTKYVLASGGPTFAPIAISDGKFAILDNTTWYTANVGPNNYATQDSSSSGLSEFISIEFIIYNKVEYLYVNKVLVLTLAVTKNTGSTIRLFSNYASASNGNPAPENVSLVDNCVFIGNNELITSPIVAFYPSSTSAMARTLISGGYNFLRGALI